MPLRIIRNDLQFKMRTGFSVGVKESRHALFRDGYDMMVGGMLFEDMRVTGRNEYMYASTLPDVIGCGTTSPAGIIDYILLFYIFKWKRFYICDVHLCNCCTIIQNAIILEWLLLFDRFRYNISKNVT